MSQHTDFIAEIISTIEHLHESLNSFLTPGGSQIPETTHIRRLAEAKNVTEILRIFEASTDELNKTRQFIEKMAGELRSIKEKCEQEIDESGDRHTPG